MHLDAFYYPNFVPAGPWSCRPVRQKFAEHQDGGIVKIFVLAMTVGLLVGAALTTFRSGAIGAVAELLVDMVCVGVAFLASDFATGRWGPCTPTTSQLYLPAVFPLAFLTARIAAGKVVNDDKLESFRRGLAQDALLSRVLGPLIGRAEHRGTGRLRHMYVLEGAAGVVIALGSQVVTIYLLYRVIGGVWLVDASVVLPPLVGASVVLPPLVDVFRESNIPPVVEGFAEAVNSITERTCP